MSNDAEMNLLIFMDGWTRGSAAKTPHKTDAVYMRGYAKGAQDRITASEVERSKLGLPAAGPATMQMSVAELPPDLANAIEEAKKAKTEADAATPTDSSSIWSALHTGALHREREQADAAERSRAATKPAHDAYIVAPEHYAKEGHVDDMLNRFNLIRQGHASLSINASKVTPVRSNSTEGQTK